MGALKCWLLFFYLCWKCFFPPALSEQRLVDGPLARLSFAEESILMNDPFFLCLNLVGKSSWWYIYPDFFIWCLLSLQLHPLFLRCILLNIVLFLSCIVLFEFRPTVISSGNNNKSYLTCCSLNPSQNAPLVRTTFSTGLRVSWVKHFPRKTCL